MTPLLRSALLAIGFTTLGITAGVTASAIAGPPGDRGMSGPMKFAQAMSGLDLSAEQQQMLSDLRDGVRSDMKQMKTDQGGETRGFAAAIASGEAIDREALHSQIDAAAAEKTAIIHKAIDGLIDVYDSLDEEQRAELSGMIQTRRTQQERREGLSGPRDDR
jgi:Spy/CpxP family protein refolding chaperone